MSGDFVVAVRAELWTRSELVGKVAGNVLQTASRCCSVRGGVPTAKAIGSTLLRWNGRRDVVQQVADGAIEAAEAALQALSPDRQASTTRPGVSIAAAGFGLAGFTSLTGSVGFYNPSTG